VLRNEDQNELVCDITTSVPARSFHKGAALCPHLDARCDVYFEPCSGGQLLVQLPVGLKCLRQLTGFPLFFFFFF